MGGSKKTVEFAKKHHKPWIHFVAGDQDIAQRLKDWLAQNAVEVLNVAGPRASKEPGIASFVILTLDASSDFSPILGMTLGATRTKVTLFRDCNGGAGVADLRDLEFDPSRTPFAEVR
jgi:hypothetical protein